MAPPKPNFTVFKPAALNQSAPMVLTFEAHFPAPPTSVQIHFDFNNSFVTLSPDASGKIFTGSIPPEALLANLDASDVNRVYMGDLLVKSGNDGELHKLFGELVTGGVPVVTVKPIANDVQWTDHLVNVVIPNLSDDFNIISTQQLPTITKKFYQHFE